MRTPLEKQETVIRWYQNEDTATVYTSAYPMMTRFDKFVDSGEWEFIKAETCGGDIVSKTYKAPKELLYGRPAKAKRKPLTEEEKEARRIQFQRNVLGLGT